MVPQSAEWRADNTDSRIADKIVRDEFAVAQKILAIFKINSVHIVLHSGDKLKDYPTHRTYIVAEYSYFVKPCAIYPTRRAKTAVEARRTRCARF